MSRDFVSAIERGLGFSPDANRIVPGRIVRFSTNGKRGDDAGWCKLFEDGRAGVFGDWRTGEQHTWHQTVPQSVDRRQDRERIAAAQAARVEEQAQRQAKAVETANLIWTRARKAEAHPYLLKKRVGANGVRVQLANAPEARGQFRDGAGLLRGLLLLVPMCDINGRVLSLQAIDARGRKSFLKGSRTAALCHLCGADALRGVDADTFDGVVGVCEGFATAWSIAHELDDGCPTFAAFSAGNLPAVAGEVRQKFPRAEIAVWADSDAYGLVEAMEAADAVAGRWVLPPFTKAELAAGLSDFNDYAQLLRARGCA